MDSDLRLSMHEIESIRNARGAAARIARSVNVHQSTVSRILSGQLTGLHRKKIARVVKALKAEASRLRGEMK